MFFTMQLAVCQPPNHISLSFVHELSPNAMLARTAQPMAVRPSLRARRKKSPLPAATGHHPTGNAQLELELVIVVLPSVGGLSRTSYLPSRGIIHWVASRPASSLSRQRTTLRIWGVSVRNCSMAKGSRRSSFFLRRATPPRDRPVAPCQSFPFSLIRVRQERTSMALSNTQRV